MSKCCQFQNALYLGKELVFFIPQIKVQSIAVFWYENVCIILSLVLKCLEQYPAPCFTAIIKLQDKCSTTQKEALSSTPKTKYTNESIDYSFPPKMEAK